MKWTPEERLTMQCYRWMQAQHPNVMIIHIANERKTGSYTTKRGRTYSPRQSKLKKMGVTAGVSDFLIAEPSDIYPALWIELKVDERSGAKRKSYPSKTQREFLNKMHQSGFAVAVAWNLDEFMGYVDVYLTGGVVECEYLIENNHINQKQNNNE